jgi:dTDP-4-dehydrorhamnose 3,5-epimerase
MTEISGVLVLKAPEFQDERGSFSETYRRETFEELGIFGEFVQDNQSLSLRKGTVRGLHFQTPPAAQAKLVRVLKGAVLDVAVDLRRGSPTFGKHVSRLLSAGNREQLFVPEGFAHGFCTLEDDTTVLYKVTRYYSPDHERGIRWNDSHLQIDWKVPSGNVLIAPRDRDFPSLDQVPIVFEHQDLRNPETNRG